VREDLALLRIEKSPVVDARKDAYDIAERNAQENKKG
jgi:hypothetical protein